MRPDLIALLMRRMAVALENGEISNFKGMCVDKEGFIIDADWPGIPSQISLEAIVGEKEKMVSNDDVTDFGWALTMLRGGRKVCRDGWNGKGMWLVLVMPNDWNNDIPFEWGGNLGKDCLPWIGMKTAQGGFVPWLASQTDLLADDWDTVE